MKNDKKNGDLGKNIQKDATKYYKLFNGGEEIRAILDGFNLILSLFVKKDSKRGGG